MKVLYCVFLLSVQLYAHATFKNTKNRVDVKTQKDAHTEFYSKYLCSLKNYTLSQPYARAEKGKTSASVLTYTKYKGKIKVLFAKRANHLWWGDFGGKSNAGEDFLLDTAVREAREESMGIFKYPKEGKDGLLDAPSYDLVQRKHIHRMYLAEHKYVSPDIFKRKLKQQINKHHKEQSDFFWVDIDDLLQCVHKALGEQNQKGNEQQYAIKTKSEKAIYIFHPMMNVLRQKPVLDWLEALSQNKSVIKIHTKNIIN